jgi:hypothetical protein
MASDILAQRNEALIDFPKGSGMNRTGFGMQQLVRQHGGRHLRNRLRRDAEGARDASQGPHRFSEAFSAAKPTTSWSGHASPAQVERIALSLGKAHT